MAKLEFVEEQAGIITAFNCKDAFPNYGKPVYLT